MPAKKVSVFNSDGTNQRATVIVGGAFRGSDGELYVVDGDETTGSINVNVAGGSFSAGPLQYTRNSTTTLVTLDTSTSSNNRPLPIMLLAGDSLGSASFGVGASGASTLRVHVGNASSIPVDVQNIPGVIISDSGGTPYTRITQSDTSRSLAVAAYQAGTWTVAATQSGTWNITNISGTVSLPTGAATSANQTTMISSLSSIDGKLPALVSGRIPVDGSGVTQPVSGSVSITGTVSTNLAQVAGVTVNTGYASPGSATQRVAAMLGVGSAAVSQSNSVATFLTTSGGSGSLVDFDFGTPSTSTLRTTAMLGVGSTAVSSTNPVPVTQGVGSAAVQIVSSTQFPYFQDFSTGNLTTSYTQLISSTGSIINRFCATNNSSTAIYIATGAAASEVVRYILMPGENAMNVPLQIAIATRIAIRSQTGTISSGQFSFNAFA